MKIMCLALLGVTLGAVPADAQSSRFYLGGTVGAGGVVGRGGLQVGVVTTAGALVGVRLGGGWSVEGEVDRGSGEQTRHHPESLWISYAGAGADRAEIERLGIRARFVRTDRAAAGYAARVVWRTREPGRLNAAAYAGLSARTFTRRTLRIITFVPDDPAVPGASPEARDADDRYDVEGGGLTGGLLFPVRLTHGLSLAPEFRVTIGVVDDGSSYRAIGAGLRVMWGLK